MNKRTKYHLTTFLLIGAVFAAGCTLDNVTGNNNTITEQDLQAAGQILGESLSSDNSGVLLSLNDALTNISNDGFQQKSSANMMQEDRSGRGNETNYKYEYNPETGTHTISFQRQVQRAVFSKTVTDTLNYIFRDNNGNFIEFPRQESDRIESINFNGRREGEISTIRKESFFVRKDTFLIDGVSNASSVLTIDGIHNGQGSIEIRRPQDGLLQRTYELQINFLNIKIDKSIAQTNGSLQQGVTGTLSWEMIIEQRSNEQSQTKTIRGTIEMNGDGTALLRFRNFLKRFQVNLNSGDVKDPDDEFEGRVQAVDLNQNSVTLVSGRTVYLNDNTEFDDDEFTSLQTVQEALNNGTHIWAEGEGTMQDGQFVVSEIEFETGEDGGDGDDGNQIEFEEYVSSVDPPANTFTLGGKVVVQINEQTSIDNEGDYLSLQAVSDALDQDIQVLADGEAVRSGQNTGSDLTAISVSFESETDGNNDSDEDE